MFGVWGLESGAGFGLGDWSVGFGIQGLSFRG